jgi:peroxiredoxin Q/BCP
MLVYCYPKADTTGCTTQSCDVRDHRQEFVDLGLAVIATSPDEPVAQLAFGRKFSLGFPLLADTDHAVADAWGTWGEKKLYGKAYMGVIRSSFIVDEDGRIEQAWYKVSPSKTVPYAQQALTG